MSTKRVKIAELKAHLSAYIRRVKKGDHILVFDRNTAVAELVPPSQPLETVLETMAAEGRVRLNLKALKATPFAGMAKGKKRVDVKRLLDDVRGD